METAQIFYRIRTASRGEEILDKVQGHLAALLQNGQLVGDGANGKGQRWPSDHCEPA
jgi:hypothetical protein